MGAVAKPPVFRMRAVVSGTHRQCSAGRAQGAALHPQLLPCTQGCPQRRQQGRIRVGWGGGAAAAVPHLGIAPRVWVGLGSISVA